MQDREWEAWGRAGCACAEKLHRAGHCFRSSTAILAPFPRPVFACGGALPAAPTSHAGGSADGSAGDGGTNGDRGTDRSACVRDTCRRPCGPCAGGKACKVDADCASEACENDVCMYTARLLRERGLTVAQIPGGYRAIGAVGTSVYVGDPRGQILHRDGSRVSSRASARTRRARCTRSPAPRAPRSRGSDTDMPSDERRSSRAARGASRPRGARCSPRRAAR